MVKRNRRGWVALVALVTAPIVVLAIQPGRADDASSSIRPFDVIDKAIERWEERPRPTALSYVVDFTGFHSDKTYRRRFRVDYAVAEHDTHVTTLRSEGPAPPFVEPEKQRLLPTETFGFVPRDVSSANVSPSASVTSLPVIAAVRAVSRYPYDVNLLGVERVGEQNAYHLALEPRHDPDAYPLRELWVDTLTYDVLKVNALQFEHVGPIRVPYRLNVEYAQEGPYWLICHAAAGATIHAGLFSYSSSAEAVFDEYHYAP